MLARHPRQRQLSRHTLQTLCHAITVVQTPMYHSNRCTNDCTPHIDGYSSPFACMSLGGSTYQALTAGGKRDALPEADARDSRPTYPPSRSPSLLSYDVLDPPCDAPMSCCFFFVFRRSPLAPFSEFTSGMSSSTHSGRVKRRALLETQRHTVSK